MLIASPYGPSRVQGSLATTASEGVTVTASGTPHTKGSWSADIIASSSYMSCGITVLIWGAQTAGTTNNRMLIDVGIGGSGSEIVLLPDLMAGGTAVWSGTSPAPAMYFFPVCIPAGTRVVARSQSVTASRTCTVIVWLHHSAVGTDGWAGTRVTAYGANSGTSTGVSHSPANGSYATATEIVASCANPIQAMQLGMDMLTDTTGATGRGLVRIGIGSTPDYVAEHLPTWEQTTVETNSCVLANMILAAQRFTIPAATRLVVSAMRNASAEARGFIIYGVD